MVFECQDSDHVHHSMTLSLSHLISVGIILVLDTLNNIYPCMIPFLSLHAGETKMQFKSVLVVQGFKTSYYPVLKSIRRHLLHATPIILPLFPLSYLLSVSKKGKFSKKCTFVKKFKKVKVSAFFKAAAAGSKHEEVR